MSLSVCVCERECVSVRVKTKAVVMRPTPADSIPQTETERMTL